MSGGAGDLNSLEQDATEGESPVLGCQAVFIVIRFHRVGLLESAALSGWYTSSKAKYRHETDSEQVP